MDKNIAIEVINLDKKFKAYYDKPNTLKERLIFWKKTKLEYHQVLKDISLEIKKGETVALIGTNGSGKSTLLKLMTKILYPTNGELHTYGKLTSLLELGAGFHPDFTGRENIYFNASIFGLTRKEIDKRVQEIIDFSELGEFIDSPVRTYSSGMYMRLAFSVAINVDADILLIDEILAVGDQHFQDKCFNKLEELRDSEKTIVIVSHSLDMIRKLCSRAVWIYHGEVKADGAPDEVIDSYLEQVIIDHANDQQNYHSTKKECLLFVDYPKSGDTVAAGTTLALEGWEVSNVLDTTVKIQIDNKTPVKASRHRRTDVLMHYQDAYGGASFNANAGYKVQLDISGMIGSHEIKISTYDEDELLAQEKIIVKIKE